MKWSEYSLPEKTGVVLYAMIGIGLMVGLLIFMFGSYGDDLQLRLGMYDSEGNTTQDFAAVIYFIFTLLGIVNVMMWILDISGSLLIPISKEQRALNKRKKEFKKKYPEDVAEAMIDIEISEQDIKDAEVIINKWEKSL